MNACTCSDEMLARHGMSALCPVCTAEYDAWAIARHEEEERAAFLSQMPGVLPGQRPLPLWSVPPVRVA